MPYVEIEPQLDDAIEFMGDLVRNEQSIRKSILGQVGTKAKTAAKRDFTSILNKRSGYLYKTIRKYMYRNGKAVVVTAHKQEDTNRYGFALAHGFTAEPKNGEYLTFQSDGKWTKTKSVTIKAHDFIEGPVKRYISGPQIERDMDQIVEKKIQKLEEKYNKGTNK